MIIAIGYSKFYRFLANAEVIHGVECQYIFGISLGETSIITGFC